MGPADINIRGLGHQIHYQNVTGTSPPSNPPLRWKPNKQRRGTPPAMPSPPPTAAPAISRLDGVATHALTPRTRLFDCPAVSYLHLHVFISLSLSLSFAAGFSSMISFSCDPWFSSVFHCFLSRVTLVFCGVSPLVLHGVSLATLCVPTVKNETTKSKGLTFLRLFDRKI